MKHKDAEQYIPWAEPEPFGADSSPFRRQRLHGLAKYAYTTSGRLVMAIVVVTGFAVAMLIWQHAGKTRVDGNLIMINSGATDTIECNNGNLKLDGDKNTYTVTGHCLRLEVFGSENHVVVDSADTISVFGDSNVLAYHSGSPTIIKTGPNNVISQRPRGH